MHSLKQRAENLKLKQIQAAHKIQNYFRKFLVAKKSKSESVRELAEAMEAQVEDKSNSHTRNLETLIQQKIESRDRSNQAVSHS